MKIVYIWVLGGWSDFRPERKRHETWSTKITRSVGPQNQLRCYKIVKGHKGVAGVDPCKWGLLLACNWKGPTLQDLEWFVKKLNRATAEQLLGCCFFVGFDLEGHHCMNRDFIEVITHLPISNAMYRGYQTPHKWPLQRFQERESNRWDRSIEAVGLLRIFKFQIYTDFLGAIHKTCVLPLFTQDLCATLIYSHFFTGTNHNLICNDRLRATLYPPKGNSKNSENRPFGTETLSSNYGLVSGRVYARWGSLPKCGWIMWWKKPSLKLRAKAPENRRGPTRKRSYSNHHASGATSNFGSETSLRWTAINEYLFSNPTVIYR